MGRRLDHPLRLARQRASITQSQLARDLELSRSTITAIEEGRTRMPAAATLAKLEQRLGLKRHQLRDELIVWLAQREEIVLSTRARATLQLQPQHVAAYPSFAVWREQIVPSPTGFASLLRINADVVLGYEQGRRQMMSDRLAGALLNVLGVTDEYLAAVQNPPPGS